MATILIVDDEPVIRDFLRTALEEAGYSCDEADNGERCIELLRKKNYDLLILDRNMGSMTGIEAITAVRSNPKLAALKILMCTSSSFNKEIEQAFLAGANDYLIKPIVIPALLAKVEKAVGKPSKA